MLGIVEMYESKGAEGEDESDDFINEELQGLINFCLTSTCQDEGEYPFDDDYAEYSYDKEYEVFKPVMVYFQNILIKTNQSDYDDEDTFAESLSAIEGIIQ